MKYYLLLLRTSQIAGTVGAGWIGRNYYQQYQALENPDQVNPDSRLGAMIAARHFDNNQVGFGVYPSIRLIHTVFGNVGEQQIGKVFNSPQAQEIMGAPRTFENNRRLGEMEYQYWQGEQWQGENIGDEFMIQFGAHVDPDVRAFLQEIAAQVRDRA